MRFSTNLKGAMIHARRWIPSNTKKRISSIRSSIPKASKTLFGSKRTKRTIAYKLSTANITSLCNFRKLSIFLFALVWYRCLAARLFEIFHHFGYLKSKYPESIANHHPVSSSRLTSRTGGASTLLLQSKFTFARIITHARLLNYCASFVR